MVWLLNSQGMKNCKSTELFHLNILTIYTNDWSPFWHVCCCHVFSSARFLNICKPRTSWPTSIDILWSGLACLPSWLGTINTGWFSSIQSEIFLQMKFIIFKAVPSNRLSFYLSSLLHVISSLFNHFCLFQNAILHEMLKLGFWNFKSIFLRIWFSLVATLSFPSFGYLFELIFASYTVSWVFNIYII